MKRVLLCTMIGLASVQTTALASGDHNHEAAVEPAPHGGVLRDAPPFKVELVLEGDQAKVYVYDKALKPAKLDKDTIVGRLKFPKEKGETKVSFKKAGEAYEATMKGIGKAHRYDLHIDLESGGKKILADFGVDNIH